MGTITKRKHTPQFKFDVAMRAVLSGNISEIARKYGVTSGLVSKWIGYLKENGASIFANQPDKQVGILKQKVDKLEQIVGQKEVEISVMKNFVDFYEPRSGK